MLDSIAKILQRDCKLQQTDRLLVGVSGGPDSLCLLNLLHSCGYYLITAHVNHQLRPEAVNEAEMVRQFASKLGIEIVSCSIDVQTYASEHSLSVEEAARTVRYNYLFEQAEVIGATAVLVAHNADDQVETILMHLLRGSGLSGLRGMEYRTLPNPWSDRIPLVRPLLSTWRADILDYLAKNEIVPVIDQSNQDRTYFRNRLRHELLPILESYNPGVRQNLLRMGMIFRDDYSAQQAMVNEAWEVNLSRHGPGYLAFNRQGLLELHPSIQRYILRKAIAHFLPGLHDVDFECIERGLQFLSEGKANGQVDLIAGLWLFREGDFIWLTSDIKNLPLIDYPAIESDQNISIFIPSMLQLNDGWQLQAMEAPDIELAIRESTHNQDLYQAWVDADDLELPLIVRSRLAGDCIQPIGMNGHSVKVSDLMINLKLPRRARRTWPLVCSGDRILWVPGCRLSQGAQVSANSRSVLHLSLCRDLST
jgi:tRNA(Ile)-lysidine synthase